MQYSNPVLMPVQKEKLNEFYNNNIIEMNNQEKGDSNASIKGPYAPNWQQVQNREFSPKSEINQKINSSLKNSFDASKQKNSTSRWSVQQNLTYMRFLQENANLFRYKVTRRGRQVFNMLAERMSGRRNAAQCKSHHQKMKNATEKGTIKQIISYIKRKIDDRKLPTTGQCMVKQEYIQEKGQDFKLIRIPSQKGNELKLRIQIEVKKLQEW